MLHNTKIKLVIRKGKKQQNIATQSQNTHKSPRAIVIADNQMWQLLPLLKVMENQWESHIEAQQRKVLTLLIFIRCLVQEDTGLRGTCRWRIMKSCECCSFWVFYCSVMCFSSCIYCCYTVICVMYATILHTRMIVREQGNGTGKRVHCNIIQKCNNLSYF